MTRPGVSTTRGNKNGAGLETGSNGRGYAAKSTASSGNRGLLRVEEAAEWLGLGRTKAYELVYRGTLTSVTIGRSRRVPVAALEAFVDELMENGGVV